MADKHILTDMKIMEISLVDEGDNPGARVEIFKRKDDELNDLSAPSVEKALAVGFAADPSAADTAASLSKETVMDIDAVTKALADAEAKLENLAKALTAKDEDIAKGAARIAELDAIVKAKDDEIAKAKAEVKEEEEDKEDDEEKVMKSLPASIRKRLEDAAAAEVELAKMRDKAELDGAIAKAKTLGVAEPDKVGALLVRMTKGKTTAEDTQMLEAILKGAAALGATSALFKSIGTAALAEVNDDPEAFLKSKADEIQKAHPGMTHAAAYDRALTENPQAYNAFIAKRRAAN